VRRISVKIGFAVAFAVLQAGCSGSQELSEVTENQNSSQSAANQELTQGNGLNLGTCSAIVDSVQVLKDGFKWTEGPAWDTNNERWIFSDVMGDTEYAISPSGDLTTLRENAGFPNGHAATNDGSFVVAQHDRTLDSVMSDGTQFTLISDSFQGNKLNSPNDVAVAQDDSIFFTDPMFGIQGFGPEKAESSLGYAGIFRMKDGSLDLINKQLSTPNGIALTNDQKSLIVSDTGSNTLYTINLDSYNGNPVEAVKLVELAPIEGGGEGHGPDGLRVSTDNKIWATGKGGINVLEADGTMNCALPFPDHVSNLSFGGSDNKLVLATSSDKVYTINLK
jgi:gluconolactonase